MDFSGGAGPPVLGGGPLEREDRGVEWISTYLQDLRGRFVVFRDVVGGHRDAMVVLAGVPPVRSVCADGRGDGALQAVEFCLDEGENVWAARALHTVPRVEC